MPSLPWIAVDSAVRSGPLVRAFAERLDSPTYAATGLLVNLLAQVMAEATDAEPTGDVRGVRPDDLATWAGWRGDAALFADAIRAILDEHGRLPGWECVVARLTRLKQNREAQRRHRDKSEPRQAMSDVASRTFDASMRARAVLPLADTDKTKTERGEGERDRECQHDGNADCRADTRPQKAGPKSFRQQDEERDAAESKRRHDMFALQSAKMFVEQRMWRPDGRDWWDRMKREALLAGQDPYLYANEHRHEAANIAAGAIGDADSILRPQA